MTRTKQAHFKSQVISKLLERLPALHPWPKDAHDWYTKPSGSEIKLGIWDFFEIKWYEDDDDEDRRRKFPGVFGNRGLGDADPVNLLVNRIMNEGRERPLEWIFSEIERALPDARKVAGAMYEIKDENAKLEQEIKKVEEECNFWREATLRLSKEVPADDETMARLGWTTEYK